MRTSTAKRRAAPARRSSQSLWIRTSVLGAMEQLIPKATRGILRKSFLDVDRSAGVHSQRVAEFADDGGARIDPSRLSPLSLLVLTRLNLSPALVPIEFV